MVQSCVAIWNPYNKAISNVILRKSEEKKINKLGTNTITYFIIPLILYSISLSIGLGKFAVPSAVLWFVCIPCCVNFSPKYVISIRVYTFACLALARNFSSFYFKSSVVHFYSFSPDQNIIFINLTTFYSNKKHVVFSSRMSQVPSTT